MKQIITILLVMSGVFSHCLMAQTSNESIVVSSGGGSSSAGIYSNFAVIGEPFVASAVGGGAASSSVGFLYRMTELQATIVNLMLYLEGLYQVGGIMNKARNTSGFEYGGTVADKITFELHRAANYAVTDFTTADVSLNTDGTATVNVPSNIAGSYYLTVRHRNSLETTAATAINVAGTTISYDFTDQAANAYGGNQKELEPGVFGFFAGDVNQDGAIDGADILSLSASASAFTRGYVSGDVNGDGVVDALDLIVTDNNAAMGVTIVAPSK